MQPEEELDNNIRNYLESEKRASKKVKWLSIARLLFFGLIIFFIWQWFSSGFSPLYITLALAALVVFIVLVVLHQRADYQYKLFQKLVQINREELQRLNLQLNTFPTGESYLSAEHPYAHDLDVFGEHSLFQLVNRSPLESAQAYLANWLAIPASRETVLQRQQAVKELTGLQAWTQRFTAVSRIVSDNRKKQDKKEDREAIFKWAARPESEKGLLFLRLMAVLLSAVNIVLFIGMLYFGIPYVYFILSYFANLFALGLTFGRCARLGAELNQSQLTIKTYLRLISSVNGQKFSSSLLSTLHSSLGDSGAYREVKTLEKLVYRFGSRGNIFYLLLGPMLMMDVHLLASAVRWKNKQGKFIRGWFLAVDQISALVSIASLTWLHRDLVFPSFTETPFVLDTRGIGHPLLSKNERVTNDFSSLNRGQVSIITGSNMSGKSTFERTLGINLVLAQVGAPVCAEKMVLYPTDIFTSMRTKDNLEESTSSFYAELKRLRQLLDHIQTADCTFYVIDEVLKGTNSEDRHKGAVSLAQQLSAGNCYGLISTHDLSLSQVADQHDLMVNFSFNSTIVDDKIIFDYKLTPGPCKSFNASKLMEIMGIVKPVKG